MEFRRPHHRAIAKALHSLDSDLLSKARCFFGGGTAITLKCDEYRESVDIDFLCSSTDGYRDLIMATWGKGLVGLLRPEETRAAQIHEIRPLRRERDKMICVIGVETEGKQVPIKFEIFKEARFSLEGAYDANFCVPTLSLEHMYAEKLLANTDRGNDSATLSRDIIDLSMLQLHYGSIPENSWAIVDEAYGPPGREAYESSVLRIRDRSWLSTCTRKMSINHDAVEKILGLHGGELPPTPSPFDT